MRRGAASGIAGRGCKQVQYVPVEIVRLDSIYLTHILRDSIVRYDDVAVFPSCWRRLRLISCTVSEKNDYLCAVEVVSVACECIDT